MISRAQGNIMLMTILNGITGNLKNTYINRVITNVGQGQGRAVDYLTTMIPEVTSLQVGIEDDKDKERFREIINQIGSTLNPDAIKLMFKRDTIDMRWSLWNKAEIEFKELIDILHRHYDGDSVDKLALYLGRKTA